MILLLKQYFTAIFLISFCFFTDIFSKIFMQNFLEKIGGSFDLFFGMKFFLAFNDGIAFSLPLKGNLQIFLSFLLLAIFIFYIFKNWNLKHKLAQLSLGFFIGGALGNMYERILFGKVTDFISVFDFFPIFNLADSYVFIGAFFAIFFGGKFEKK